MSEFPRIICVTSDSYLWALRPFAYLFTKYAPGIDVLVGGYTPPRFNLPPNFQFHQIDASPYPPNRWSDGLIRLLSFVPDDVVAIVLEDYWMIRPVDLYFLSEATSTMLIHPEILKIDLTTDRLHARGDPRDAQDYASLGHYDLIITPAGTPYRMSLQAALWNRDALLRLLKPEKSPWEVEIHIDPPAEYLVLGTRQWPMRYANGIYKGKLFTKQLEMIKKDDMNVIDSMIQWSLEKYDGNY